MKQRLFRTKFLGEGLARVAVLLPILWLVLGCNSSTVETATITFSISVDEKVITESLPPAPVRRASGLALRAATSDVSGLGFSPADITQILIDVKEAATDAPLYVNFDLVHGSSGWTGTLPSLPKDKALVFIARAFDSSGTLLFNGSTQQTLLTDNEQVSISMAPANNGATITLPRITKIVIPSEFPFSQRGNITFTVEATAGEQLTFTLLPADQGGTFSPASGFFSLVGTLGSFVSVYTPPDTVTTTTVFTHQVKVTNAAGHSVLTTFKTKVLPRSESADATGTQVSVNFNNPVINDLMASRLPGTNSVTWEASIADNGPASELTFAWSFTPAGTYDPAPAFTTQSNPTTMENYTTSIEGTLRLAVTDGEGYTTTLFYELKPNQFLDDPTQMGAISGISGGGSHTCALFNDGTARCWGLNTSGQLGLGHSNNIGDNELPYTAGAVPLDGTAVQLAVGTAHACALLSTGKVRCWGINTHGQLGYGHTRPIGDDEPITAESYVNLGAHAMRIAAGGNHTCALLTTGKVRCWGHNNYGQLGYAHTHNIGDDEPVWDVSDVQLGAIAQDIVAGGAHTCALLYGGKVRCWGYNGNGQLGYGNTIHIGDNEHPSVAGDVNVGGAVLQLSAGQNHTCALLDTGFIRCWGHNGNGQLGYGHISDLRLPGGDVNTGSQVVQVSTGDSHTCALLSTGDIKCWGYGASGRLGYGNISQQTSPPSTTVNVDVATAFQIATGGAHTCALLSTGAARCWGLSNYGQLGYGNTLTIGDNEQPSVAGDIQILAPTP